MFAAVAAAQRAVSEHQQPASMLFNLYGRDVRLPAEQFHFLAHLPHTGPPPGGDPDDSIHYRRCELYQLTPPDRHALYVYREIDCYPEESFEVNEDRVVSAEEAAALCHAAGVTPTGPLAERVEQAGRAALDAVYSASRGKAASSPTALSDTPSLSRLRFTYGDATIRWGQATKRYDLVRALWDTATDQPARPRTEADVLHVVYPRQSKAKGKLKNLIQEVRKLFAEDRVSLALRHEAGMIWLEVRGD